MSLMKAAQIAENMNIQLQLDKAAELKERYLELEEAEKAPKERLRLSAAYDAIYQKLVAFCSKNKVSIFDYSVSEFFDYETFETDVKEYED